MPLGLQCSSLQDLAGILDAVFGVLTLIGG